MSFRTAATSLALALVLAPLLAAPALAADEPAVEPTVETTVETSVEPSAEGAAEPAPAPTTEAVTETAPQPSVEPAAASPAQKPALAASDPALFAFKAGFDGSYIYSPQLVVSGRADPESGTLTVSAGEQCFAPVDETTGEFSCSITQGQSRPNLPVTVQALVSEQYVTLGTATVHVLLPPTIDNLEMSGEAPSLYVYERFATITGYGVPAGDGVDTTVRVSVPTAEGTRVCVTETDDSGAFSCTQTLPIMAGVYVASITQQPSWAGTRRSLPANDPLELHVIGPSLELDGDVANDRYPLAQGQSLTLTGYINDEAQWQGLTFTANMRIGGAAPVQWQCATIDGDTFSCRLPMAPTLGGTYRVEITARSEGSPIAINRAATVVVTGAVAVAPPVVTPDPVETPEPLDFTVEIGAGSGALHPGDALTLSSSGLPEGTTVEAEIHSTPIALGSTVVGADGTFSLPTTIPLAIEPGAHTIVVTITPPGRAAQVSRSPITIEAPVISPVDATTDVTPPPAELPVAPSLSGARNQPGAANGISDSIRPFWETLTSPVAIGSAVLAGLVFLVLVAFPAEILTAAIKDRYKFLQRNRTPRAPRWFAAHPIVSGVALLALATLIAGFADPAFGADLASLRMLIACFIAALIVSYGAYLLTSRIMNRRWALPTSISLRPYTLIITVIGVILSRVLDFSPGFLFGLMLGLSFPPETPDVLRSRARLIRTAMILGIAVVAWFAYSFTAAALATAEPSFGGALLVDTLAALSTEGLTGMLIAMLPFLFLDGHDLWKHSKRVWASVYAVVIVVFFLVVAPKPESWGDLGAKYGPWALILGAFTVVSLGAYVFLRWDTARQRVKEDA